MKAFLPAEFPAGRSGVSTEFADIVLDQVLKTPILRGSEISEIAAKGNVPGDPLAIAPLPNTPALPGFY